MMKKTTIIEGITVLFIILFLYTAISKLLEYSIFKEQIATSPLLAPFSKIIAMVLPWIEFIVVFMLIMPRWRLKGLYASFILMILFTLYIIGIMLFNKELPCSCGGILAEMSWTQHIIFNLIFIALSAIAIILEKNIIYIFRKEMALINKAEKV
jgi:hypothetical protein